VGRAEGLPALAIGIDAAEATLVQGLMARGELPVLRSLVAQGMWGRVVSPAHIGSGAVWPTFMTGSSPRSHGIHYDWPWDPAAMRVAHLSTDHLTPFWRAFARDGHAVGVLDVPFAPLGELPGGIEISEWGAHDWLRGCLEVRPASRQAWVRREGGLHPFAARDVGAKGPADHRGLARLVSASLEGVRRRGTLATRLVADLSLDLLVVVFPEVHKASHALWHTIDPAHPAHPAGGVTAIQPGLLDLVREVDRQIGRVVEAAGPRASVLVFSLHGMRGRTGVPAILDPLLRRLGFAAVQEGRAQSWPERGRRLLGVVKGLTPPWAKRVYHHLAPRSLAARVAHQSLHLPYDWSRTVAFPLPSDQHGWIRLNLAGREAGGILSPARFDEVSARIEAILRGLTSEGGVPIVRNVVRLAGDDGVPPPLLPDLVVHWEDAAAAAPLRLRTPPVSADPVATRFTGQHAFDGFFIARPRPVTPVPGDTVTAEDLHRLLPLTLAPGRAGRP
jgi:predicted AlkP superfamily phosphohydrolase/phosphomutase